MLRASCPLLFAAVLLAGAPSAFADDLPLFRLFLRDGTSIPCLGEFARVGERVVFTLPLTPDNAESRLVTLDADRIDWGRTDRYTESLRSARYAESRGETDFAQLSADVARVLNEIALTADPTRRLALAQAARQRLAAWPANHYNYRADDVRQILQLVDEAISELRASAGEEAFDLAFVAKVVPPPPEPLLAPPTAEERLQAAFAVAERASDPAERQSLLGALLQVIDRMASSLPSSVGGRLRGLVRERLDQERRVEERYGRLVADATARARSAAADANVRAVQRAIAMVQQTDGQLGRQRPDRVASLLLALQEQLDAARRLRLARDRWAVNVRIFRAYRDALAAPLARLDGMNAGLDSIKRLAGPATGELGALSDRAAQALRELNAIVPPTDLASAHALFVSAAHLAVQAVAARREAVRTGQMPQAWSASSAAAGAIMLLARARADLEQALSPPDLK